MSSISRRAELVLSLVRRDLKARYKESVLGFFWSLLRPAFLTLVLWIVFSLIVPLKIELPAPFWAHVLISVLTWNFFLGAVNDATFSIVANGNLLKKVPLRPEIFPLAAVVANGVHFVLALTVAIPVLLVVGQGMTLSLLWLPLLVALVAMLALGFGMLLGALNVYYRDTGSALELIGLAWFYASPVIYPVSIAWTSFRDRGWGPAVFSLYLANPVAPLLAAMRRTVLYPAGAELSDRTIALGVGWTILVTMALLLGGRLAFSRFGGDFADEL